MSVPSAAPKPEPAGGNSGLGGSTMRAAARFVDGLRREGLLAATVSLKVELYGSLGATGKGHGSDKAVLLGLMGHEPDTVEVDAIPALLETVRRSRRLVLDGAHEIGFQEREDLKFHRRETLPLHTTTRFTLSALMSLDSGMMV